MAQRLTARTPITRVYRNTADAQPATEFDISERVDTLAVEEPLQIRVDGTDFVTTMRTPGHDFELVHGLLYAEGVIAAAADVATMRYCGGAVGGDGLNTFNTIDVTLAAHTTATASPSGATNLPVRTVTMNSACGICGTTSIDDVEKRIAYPIQPVTPTAEFVLGLPGLLHDDQKAFRRTGGIHAAGAITGDGELLYAREDIGRHNAADKVIGALLMNDMVPAHGMYLVMTSRASFELVQKAVLPGFSGLVAMSAATSLAVKLARQTGFFLSGFTRENRMNLYNGSLENIQRE